MVVERVVLQYLLLAVLVCPTIVMTFSYGRIIVEVRHVVKQRQRCAPNSVSAGFFTHVEAENQLHFLL